MDTLFIVSKNFVNNDGIITSLKEIAVKAALTLSIESEPGYTVLQFFKDIESDSGYFEIFLNDEEWFNQTKRDKNFIGGYGNKGTIEFNYDDIYLFNVLKLLLNNIPELLVYNEVGKASPDKPFVFSKAHFDVAKDLYSLQYPPLK
jgi:hypothetical protein